MFGALALMQDKGEQFHDFRKDTVWNYERTEVGKKKTTVKKVLKQEGGKVYFEEAIFEKDAKEPSSVHSFAQYIEEGFLKMATVEDGKLGHKSFMYKIGSKKGDHWLVDPTDKEDKTEVTHMGLTEVTVPAGKFKDVVQLRMTLSLGTIDTYLVSGIGVVKEELRFPPDAPDMQVLVKFSEAR
jgi:hypothetical protein